MPGKKNKTLSRLMSAVSKYKLTALLSLLFSALGSAAGVMSTLQLGRAIDMARGAGSVDYPGLYRALALLAGLFLASALFGWLASVLANRTAYGTARVLRKQAFSKLGRLPLSFFDSHSHGDIVNRFTSDLDNVSDALAVGLVSLFSGAVVVVCSLIMMFLLNVTLTVVILLVTPLCLIAGWALARLSQRNFRRQQETAGELSGFVSEMVGNQKTVHALGYEKRALGRFYEINSRLHKAGLDAQVASALINPSARFVDHISYLLVGVVGGFMAVSGTVSVGAVSSFLIYSAQFSKPFNEVSGIIANLQTAFASAQRIFALLDEIEEAPDAPGAPALLDGPGEVVFDGVDFSYDPARPLIEKLSFKAPPGGIVAIVGPTGAGKTTIVNLLMRFYEPQGGQILVDGQRASDMSRDSLRRRFGMVLQDTWLLAGTIRENIAYGKPGASEDEVIAAAKRAHAHSFIKQLPKGYSTVISEDGGSLSQGQRQLLTIARVMLTDPRMLILDEATSSIDTLTERRVQKAFLDMMRGRTSFVIAHRLSTIQAADLILVLDKGKVMETGTHQSLLEAGGFYARLYHSQYE